MDDLVKNEVDRITGKPQKKDVPQRVVSKKSALQIAAENFIEEDLDGIREDVRKTIKKRGMSFAGDILNFIVDRIFHSGGSYKSSSSGNVIRQYDNPSYRTNYSGMSVKRNEMTRTTTIRFDFSDLVWPKRSGAQWLLDKMIEEIETSQRRCCSVAKMYDILDDPSNLEMNDDNFGWYDLSPGSGTYIREVEDGYRLFLPPVVELKD